jgi:hypothetical protein
VIGHVTCPIPDERSVARGCSWSAVVPADDGGDLWAMGAVFALVAAAVLAYRALVRAAAKVEAALDDELDSR